MLLISVLITCIVHSFQIGISPTPGIIHPSGKPIVTKPTDGSRATNPVVCPATDNRSSLTTML